MRFRHDQHPFDNKRISLPRSWLLKSWCWWRLLHKTGEQSGRKTDPSSRRLWTALREIDRYLTSQSAWLVNYAERHRAGLRVGTSLTEGTANFLVNRRMNKSQQMRWSRRGADLLLQVRCAVVNGKLGSGTGQIFKADVDPASNLAMAA
jgi:hypothetical protein